MKISISRNALFYIMVLALAAVSLSSCRKDLCESIYCANGGYCANGLCNCPVGYTGSDCRTEKTPVSMTITKIILTNYPVTTPTGRDWDIQTGPDVFLSIEQGTTASDYQNTGIFYDAAGESLTYTTTFPMTINNLNDNYSFGIWDYDDSDPDDFMTGFYFVPLDQAGGLPSVLLIDVSGIGMEIHVTWNFN